MSGPIALHGGGEFLPGDEPFLRALLEVVRDAAGDRPPRIAVVPAAAARRDPEAATRLGAEALGRAAEELGLAVDVEAVPVVDAASAADAGLAERLSGADLVYLPGGEPDVVPAILAGSLAWEAIRGAHRRGTLVAGASAGAMALSSVTWTPAGLRPGLGLLEGILVIPHFEHFDPTGREDDIAAVARERLSAVGLDERTGVIREGPGRWRVAGVGAARWLPAGAEPVAGRDGDVLPIDA